MAAPKIVNVFIIFGSTHGRVFTTLSSSIRRFLKKRDQESSGKLQSLKKKYKQSLAINKAHDGSSLRFSFKIDL